MLKTHLPEAITTISEAQQLNKLMHDIYDLPGNDDLQNMAFDPCKWLVDLFKFQIGVEVEYSEPTPGQVGKTFLITAINHEENYCILEPGTSRVSLDDIELF